ncbi:MAG: ferrochelatase, partial [Caldilineaceae bacterium]
MGTAETPLAHSSSTNGAGGYATTASATALATGSLRADGRIGILLTNVGSPDSPTAKAVRPYLAEFLGDPRVIELSPWLWKPLLHGVLLNTRPRRSAKLYQNIWSAAGSPLVANLRQQAKGLQALLTAERQDD